MEASLVLNNYNYHNLLSLSHGRQPTQFDSSSIIEMIKPSQIINNYMHVFYNTSILRQFFIDVERFSELISESSSTLRIIKRIRQISQIYNLYDVGAIEHFLINNQFLIGALELIYLETKKLFTFSNLYLGVLTDYEEGYEGLLIEIDTNLDIDKAVFNLDQIIDWYVSSVPDNQRKYITITLK